MAKTYVVKISKKGQVSIPAELRRKYGFSDKAVFIDEGGVITIIPLIDMEDAFGLDGEVMLEIAREIVKAREKEIELET